MFSRVKTNESGLPSTVAASLSLLMLWGWVAAPLCVCRCAHASSAPAACHRHASHATDRSTHPCEHACATMTVDRSAEIVAAPASPDPAPASAVIVSPLVWTPPSAPPRARPIERDVGPPQPAPLFQILRS